MKLPKLLLPLIFLCNHLPGQNKSVFRLDLDDLQPEYASRVIKSCEYIPLEYSQNSRIMKIDQLLIKEDRVIVVDNMSNSIYIFNDSGKFISSIKGLHKVKPNIPAYLYNNVWIDHFKDEILITTVDLRYYDVIFRYDLDGNFIATDSAKYSKLNLSPEYLSVSPGRHLYVRSFTDSMNNRKKEDSTFLQLKDTQGASLKNEIPIDSFSRFSTPSDLVFASGKRLIFNKKGESFVTIPYHYTIYQFDSSGISNSYEIKFTIKNSLPEDFLYSSMYDKKRTEYLEKNSMVAYSISNAFKNKDFLFFSVACYDPDLTGAPVLYDIHADKLINLEKVLPDSSNAYLPFFSGPGYTYYNDSFYSYIYSDDLFSAKKENTDRKRDVRYPDKIDRLLKQKAEEVNPVVLRLKFKPTNNTAK